MDFDLFDDMPQTVRAGGKFQPKAKPRPFAKKKNVVGATQPVSAVDIVNCTGGFEAGVVDGFLSAGKTDNWHSCVENPIGENADIFIGLESLDDDILPRKSTILGNPVPSEEPIVYVSDSTGAEHDRLALPLDYSVDISASVSKIRTSSSLSDMPASQDPFTRADPIVTTNRHLTDNQNLDIEAYPCLENLDMSEFTSSFGHRTGKMQPILKRQANRSRNDTDIHDQDVAEPFNHDGNTPWSGPAFTNDNVIELSSIRLCKSAPSQSTSEVLEDEVCTDFRGFSHQGSVISGENLEAGHELLGELASPRANAENDEVHVASECSVQHQASKSNETIVACRVLRERRRPLNGHKLMDDSEGEEGLESADLPAESLYNPIVNEGDMTNEEIRLDDKPQKRKSPDKRFETEKEKPVRKRRKNNTKSLDAAKPGPKRFPHSSQRRKVDKALLEIPQDEIDIRKVIFKDAIRLMEHNERVKKKEAKSLKEQLQNQRNANHTVNDDEDEPFGDVSYDEERLRDEGTSINYQSFMHKTPRSRWSKQDTEVFYQALQLFHTDFSCIQRCYFRDKTPRQILSKYKKEHQQNPSRIREALMNPAKEIEILKQVAAKIQEICRANSASLTEEEDEENPDADVNMNEESKSEEIDETAKSEEIDEAIADGTMRADVEETHGSTLDLQDSDNDDDDDDLSRWSQYKSDL
ncbi:OLC1v1031570C1 [Oldenlandia corymbosa var. corymbosa]|uniref:OLC1v1031570C1 n=1 Tax=Oldenlandia corymbosa var. corymbosa TaxID=529605 RepID=A0AAV1CM42_OLDCO|nr:OLC1v1031570C1 [Oldenlandia corymbosa var. corymbosa]